jgi:hypothetical protein
VRKTLGEIRDAYIVSPGKRRQRNLKLNVMIIGRVENDLTELEYDGQMTQNCDGMPGCLYSCVMGSS